MRLVLVFGLFSARLLACSCAGPVATPCLGAGMAAAVFTGKVLEIADPSAGPFARQVNNTGQASSRRAPGSVVSQRSLRVVRLSVGDVLSGVDASQREIEILTGFGGGDCGYPFQTGTEYVVYAYRNPAGKLETGICTRTRPSAQAAEDVRYIRELAHAPETGELRVQTAFPGIRGLSGATIIAERQAERNVGVVNAAGEAVFRGLGAGEYTLHVAADGDLPDDPKAQLYAKGCLVVSLFRTLRISGRVNTENGAPASRVHVQVRSTGDRVGDGDTETDADGRYELRILRPGQYHLGINLDQTPTRTTPYPRWFHPGTADSASATMIEFSGRAEGRVYDLILPKPLPERTVDGVVLRADGTPSERTRVTVFDEFSNVAAQELTDASGHFVVQLFAGTPYQLHAVDAGSAAISAPPVEIQADVSRLSLRLILTQPGNSALDVMQRRR